MATQVLTDAKMFAAQYDLSARLSELRLTVGADAVEDTAFGAGYHTHKPGLRRAEAEFSGYYEPGSGLIDDVLYTRVGTADVPVSFSAQGGAASDYCWMMKAGVFQYDFGGQIGEMNKLTARASATGSGVQLVRGQIFEAGTTAKTSASNSGVIQLGAVSSTQKLYAVLHVFSFSGTSITIKVRSAVTNFATITDRITFATVSAATSEWATPVSGAVTDTFWRVDWTGTFTSCRFFAGVGIQ